MLVFFFRFFTSYMTIIMFVSSHFYTKCESWTAFIGLEFRSLYDDRNMETLSLLPNYTVELHSGSATRPLFVAAFQH